MSDLLSEYAEAITRSVASKDNNGFWPVGIPLLSYPSAHRALAVLMATPGRWRTTSLNPTAVLCLMLYLTHGVRRTEAPRDLHLRLARSLLEHVAASRGRQLVPEGAMRLVGWRDIVGAAEANHAWDSTTDTAVVVEAFQLGAQLWALGEAAYFFCHRLLTERHGPYPLPDGSGLLCRHAANLDVWTVWPEVSVDRTLPSEIAIWSTVRPQAVRTFGYDLFGNSVFALNPQRDCRSAEVFVAAGNTVHKLAVWEIRELRSRLAAVTERVVAVIDGADVARLAQATSDTMRLVCQRILHLSVGHEWPTDVEAPFTFAVRGSREELSAYYDWRCRPAPAEHGCPST